jgi:HD-GYP domain-containing protein (c-di-GMP phosphodiesterase class II)
MHVTPIGPYVTLEPPDSPLEPIVRECALRGGFPFRRREAAAWEEALDRELLVLDLASASLGAVEAGPFTIVVDATDWNHRPVDPAAFHPDAFEVIDPSELSWRLPRALRNLARLLESGSRGHSQRDVVRTLNEFGLALSAIREPGQLAHEILRLACRLMVADGATLYLVEGDHLRFAAARNDTVSFEPREYLLPLDDRSIAGHVALRGCCLNLSDLHALPPDAPYCQNHEFDLQYGYRSRSMLLVPMRDHRSRVLGVLSLINRKPEVDVPLLDFDQVLPFDEEDVNLALSIASQGTVALENHRLLQEVSELFDGFVEAAVKVIETRDPPTGGHSHRVADLTVDLARAIDASDDEPFSNIHFSTVELRAIHHAGLLHDFGKVGVREQVLCKAERLHPWEIALVEARFRQASLGLLLARARGTLDDSGLREAQLVLARDLALFQAACLPSTRLTPPEIARLEALASKPLGDEAGATLLSSGDLRRLLSRWGSLDEEERREAEAHALHTANFLAEIPWTVELASVPSIASAHHEKLDGSGYPRGLRAEAIPYAARIMAVCDVYDALTAVDRPYKGPMPSSRALGLLRAEAREGRLDAAVVELLARRVS